MSSLSDSLCNHPAGVIAGNQPHGVPGAIGPAWLRCSLSGLTMKSNPANRRTHGPRDCGLFVHNAAGALPQLRNVGADG